MNKFIKKGLKFMVDQTFVEFSAPKKLYDKGEIEVLLYWLYSFILERGTKNNNYKDRMSMKYKQQIETTGSEEELYKVLTTNYHRDEILDYIFNTIEPLFNTFVNKIKTINFKSKIYIDVKRFTIKDRQQSLENQQQLVDNYSVSRIYYYGEDNDDSKFFDIVRLIFYYVKTTPLFSHHHPMNSNYDLLVRDDDQKNEFYFIHYIYDEIVAEIIKLVNKINDFDCAPKSDKFEDCEFY